MSAPLYGDVVADHARNPRNRGALESPDLVREGINPLCGDRVRIEPRIAGEQIEAVRFQAEACMVTIAASSLLTSFGDTLRNSPCQRSAQLWLRKVAPLLAYKGRRS